MMKELKTIVRCADTKAELEAIKSSLEPVVKAIQASLDNVDCQDGAVYSDLGDVYNDTFVDLQSVMLDIEEKFIKVEA